MLAWRGRRSLDGAATATVQVSVTDWHSESSMIVLKRSVASFLALQNSFDSN